MSEGKRIGKARCPLCGSEGADVGVNVKGRAYIVASCCGSQTFARSAKSDGIIRGLIVERREEATSALNKGFEEKPKEQERETRKGAFNEWGF